MPRASAGLGPRSLLAMEELHSEGEQLGRLQGAQGRPGAELPTARPGPSPPADRPHSGRPAAPPSGRPEMLPRRAGLTSKLRKLCRWPEGTGGHVPKPTASGAPVDSGLSGGQT